MADRIVGDPWPDMEAALRKRLVDGKTPSGAIESVLGEARTHWAAIEVARASKPGDVGVRSALFAAMVALVNELVRNQILQRTKASAVLSAFGTDENPRGRGRRH